MKKIVLLACILVFISISAAEAAVRYTNEDGDVLYSLSAGILNVQIAAESGTAVTAVYKDGRLNEVSINEIENGGAKNVVSVPSEDCEVKTFLFEDLSKLRPMQKTECFTKDSFTLTQYTPVLNAQKSTEYSAAVNGENVFVEDYKDISYVRFAAGGKTEIEITAAENISSYDISPHSLNINAEVSQNRLKFPVQSGQKLIVTVNGGRKLFVFADWPEENAPSVNDDGVYLLTDFDGIDGTGGSVITEAFQKAIDDIAVKPDGGILFVPNGMYKTGTLKVHSNVKLYLESGALIQGTSDKADYPYPIVTKDGNEILISALLCFDTAQNAGLYGRGIIDGDGLNLRATGRDAWLVSVTQSNNVRIEDVILRDPAAFNSHIQYSDNVTVDGVKLINDITNPNTDGIDPDSSRNIIIQNSFAYCSDDCVSVKTHRYSTLVRNAYDIKVMNNVFWTKKSALKIGDETSAHRVHDVSFENNDIIHADRAMTIYVYDGAAVSNISFVNNRAEFIGGDSFRRHLDFWVKTRAESCNNPGSIENIIIKDFYAEDFGEQYSAIEGYNSQHGVKNIYIDNYVVGGIRRNSADEARIKQKNYASQLIFGPAPAIEPVDESIPEYDRSSAFVQEGDYISVEAEHYIKNTDGSKAVWQEVPESVKRGAVGNKSMYAFADVNTDFGTGISGSPRLDYKVEFKEAGTYYLWTRTYGAKGARNTLHAGVDGMLKANLNSLCCYANYGGWYWNNKNKNNTYAVIEISEPGEHTVNFWAGTTGLYFDRFILLKAESGTELIKYMSTGRKGMGYPESNVGN